MGARKHPVALLLALQVLLLQALLQVVLLALLVAHLVLLQVVQALFPQVVFPHQVHHSVHQVAQVHILPHLLLLLIEVKLSLMGR